LGDSSSRKKAVLASMLLAGKRRLFHDARPTDRSTWAAVTLAWHALLRSSEYVPSSSGKFDPAVQLCVKDVEFFPTFRSPTHMVISVKASKTDPFRNGQIVVVGATGTELCAVSALQQMLFLGGKRSPNAPLFIRSDGIPLCRNRIQRAVQDMAILTGAHKSDYGTHSLRRGGATALYNAGFSRDFIQLMGKWRSDAFKLYISQLVSSLLGISGQMQRSSEARSLTDLELTY
jgi:hypothetical protein